MAIGDARYHAVVPEETQDFIEEQGMSVPNTFVFSADAPPYYPDSIRSFMFGDAPAETGNGDCARADGEAPPAAAQR